MVCICSALVEELGDAFCVSGALCDSCEEVDSDGLDASSAGGASIWPGALWLVGVLGFCVRVGVLL